MSAVAGRGSSSEARGCAGGSSSRAVREAGIGEERSCGCCSMSRWAREAHVDKELGDGLGRLSSEGRSDGDRADAGVRLPAFIS